MQVLEYQRLMAKPAGPDFPNPLVIRDLQISDHFIESLDIKPAIVVGYAVGSLGDPHLAHLLNEVLESSALFGELIHTFIVTDP